MTNRLNTVVFTYKALRDLDPAPKGQRYIVRDSLTPLMAQMTDRGHLSGGMKRRWKGHAQPVWLKIGDFYFPPERTIAGMPTVDPKAERVGDLYTILGMRKVAQAWALLDEQGIHPKAEAKRLQDETEAALQREQTLRFRNVAEWFKDNHLVKLAKCAEMKSAIDRVYVAAWGDRPLLDIQQEDVKSALQPLIDDGKVYQALNVFRWGSLLFSKASPKFKTKGYNPFKDIKPKDLIGDTPAAERTLTDAEMRAVWQASAQLHQHGAIVKLLLLTGCRLTEIVGLRRDEIGENEIIIQGPRRKKINGKTAPDLFVPITKTLRQILDAQPVCSGPFIFSTTYGSKPLAGFSGKKKTDLDRLAKVQEAWNLHDLRRTMRTHLPACGIREDVAEAMIGHVKKGIIKVYNRYTYMPEKIEAFPKWEKRLLGIVETPPPNVDSIAAARARRSA